MGTPSTAPTLDQIAGALRPLVPPGYRALLFGSRAGGATVLTLESALARRLKKGLV